MYKFPLSVLVLLLAGGCLQSASESRKTGEIRMIFHAEKNGDGRTYLRAQAYDTRGGMGWVDSLPFSSGDELSASAGAQTVRFPGGTGILEADAPSVTISFHRAEHQDAPETVIIFPEPFDLEELPPEISRSDQITVRWRPTGPDPMSVEAKGKCIRRVDETVHKDSGWVTVELEAKSETEVGESCQVELTVTRTRLGTVDKALWSSSKAFGLQVRSATFRSVP